MIVVLGAGLAGLSCSYHLGRSEHLLVEKEREVGGLARSVDEGGFLFDFTGHLLHLRDPYAVQLCDELLGDDQVRLERSAWIRYGDALVPYPFQVHTSALPVEVRIECLEGFARSLLPENRLPPGELLEPERPLPLSFLDVKRPSGGYDRSFHDWVIHTFGEGFAKHFFLPYNEKNFAADLRSITADWVSWAVPKPDLEDVVRGALGLSKKEFGYNPRFRYPRSGGIHRLPRALAERVSAPRLGTEATRIEARDKRVHFADGTSERYDALVSSLPLPELVAAVDDLPDAVRAAAARLRWCAVSSFNYGIDHPLDHDRHWVYFPERAYRFYRVGFPSNLTPGMAPAGRSSVCAEVAYPSDAFPPGADEDDAVLAELAAAGVLDPERVVLRRRLDLPYAYVLFDEARREALPLVFGALLERDIVPVGRYGSWDYLSMEAALLQGKETAEYLLGRGAKARR